MQYCPGVSEEFPQSVRPIVNDRSVTETVVVRTAVLSRLVSRTALLEEVRAIRCSPNWMAAGDGDSTGPVHSPVP